MLRSKDLIDSASSRASISMGYIRISSREFHEWIGPVIKKVFPAEFAKYQAAFKAGRLFGDYGNSCFLGEVVVVNLQIHQHQDRGDGNLCVIFAHGSYKGGYLVVPSLKLVLK